MINLNICEPPYILKALESIRNEINDDYNFIISRIQNSNDKNQYEECILEGKINILIHLSDEAGIPPPHLDRLHLVFRTYSNKSIHDDKKIFAIPCGYSCGYDGYFNNDKWIYKEFDIKPLKDREYDIFYSGQFSKSRISCIDSLNLIKDKYKSIVNITDGFAHGYGLEEYYKIMSNSKIAIVPEGVAVPESFRYFESFLSNCIVITTFPVHLDIYNNWFYKNSPAVFIKDWSQLTEKLLNSILYDDDKIDMYDRYNKIYFDENISTEAIGRYILDKIKKIENL